MKLSDKARAHISRAKDELIDAAVTGLDGVKENLNAAKDGSGRAGKPTDSGVPEGKSNSNKAKAPTKGSSVEFFLFMLLCLLAFGVASCVGGGSDNSADDDKAPAVEIEKKPEYQVNLEVTCSENFLFNRYDIEILVDNLNVGYLDHGASDTFQFTVEEGSHELLFRSADDASVNAHKAITVEEEAFGICSLTCKSDMVEIDSFELLTADEKAQKDAEEQREKEQEQEQEAANTSDTDSSAADSPESSADQSSVADSESEDAELESEADGQSHAETTLNTQTCPDLNTLLTQTSEDASWFSSKYRGRIIEFDGYIADIVNHENYDTRYDVLILGGDYGASPSLGPYFRITDANTHDMGIDDLFLPSYMSNGSNVHIVAKVGDYSSMQGWLELDPVTIEPR